MIPSKQDLEQACRVIAPYCHRTPVLTSESINKIVGAEIFFKCDNFQKMGAFKMRGGCFAASMLSEADKQKGIATHSSGNFAQAIALSAKNLGIKAYVVMPSSAPNIKKEAVKGYGGEVIESEPSVAAREAMLQKVVERTGATFIHPSNDTNVIIGHSTAAVEFLESVDNLDCLFTPVGGGGLLSGTALAAHHFSPKTKVYAGEPFGADDAWHSLQAGEIVPVKNPKTIADGLRTSLGSKNFPIIKDMVEDIIRVEEDEILSAMRIIWERMKIIIEPSSAVPFAALIREKEHFQGKRIGIIISGGNVDLDDYFQALQEKPV